MVPPSPVFFSEPFSSLKRVDVLDIDASLVVLLGAPRRDVVLSAWRWTLRSIHEKIVKSNGFALECLRLVAWIERFSWRTWLRDGLQSLLRVQSSTFISPCKWAPSYIERKLLPQGDVAVQMPLLFGITQIRPVIGRVGHVRSSCAAF